MTIHFKNNLRRKLLGKEGKGCPIFGILEDTETVIGCKNYYDLKGTAERKEKWLRLQEKSDDMHLYSWMRSLTTNRPL